MTFYSIAASCAALWWTVSIAVLILSSLAAALFPWRLQQPAMRRDLPPVTAIVPVKALDAGFEAAQISLIAQSYPGLEFAIATAESDSAALRAARQILATYKATRARVTLSQGNRAASPKLNTLWTAIVEAQTDLVLTKDSNIRIEPGAVENFVRHLGPNVGLVSAISIATNPESLAAWTEASIVNSYHGRILMLARAMGLGFGCGKIMLFRRSDLERTGGLEGLSWALGEDAAFAAAMKSAGLRAAFADRVSLQYLGSRTWEDVWHRQLRWMLIWRVQVPLAFMADFIGSAVPTALAGALAAPLLGLPPVPVAISTLGIWCLLEMLLCAVRGWPLSIQSPIAFLVREVITPALWFRALTTNKVAWAGKHCRAQGNPAHAQLPVAVVLTTCTRTFDK